MGKKARRTLLDAALVLALLIPSAVFSAPKPFPANSNSLLAAPSANMLGHAQYGLSGRFQYFTSSEFGSTDTSESANFNNTSELRIGIENLTEIGLQYGRDFSFSLKALLLKEDLLWPDLAFGVRSLFGTQEGGLYGLADGPVMDGLRGESYLAAAKSFPSGSRVHLGVSVMNILDADQATVSGGLEQDIGGGAFIGYEVFERFSEFHQLLTLQWRWRNVLAFTMGMTEFQSWIRQDGKWGFFLAPEKPLADGYNSPGLTASIQILGRLPRRAKKTLPERVSALEAENAALAAKLEAMRSRLERVSAGEPAPATSPAASAAAASASGVPAGKGEEIAKRVSETLRSISEKTASDLADPKDIRGLMADLVGMGPAGAEALRKVAADTGAGNLRFAALQVMSYSRDTSHAAALRTLCRDGSARIRREALAALVKVEGKAALEEARRLTSDPDETVAMAAGEAYRLLSGEPAAPAAPADSKGAPGGKSSGVKKAGAKQRGAEPSKSPTPAP